MNQDVIYITGHQHPDTDSIAAAIGYAFFKRANGVKAVPCRLGKLGTETKYLLKRFGFEEPMLLEDARVKMSEIEIDEPTTIMPDKTIYEAIQLMHGAGKQTCGVVDEEDRVVGMLTMNDIGLVAMGDTASTEKLLEDIAPENINTAISGRDVVLKLLLDGEPVYTSQALKPGESIDEITLDRALTTGRYDAMAVTSIYGDDGEVQFTNRVPVTLNVQ